MMPQTWSLKEERVKTGQIIKSNPKQVKQGTVLRGLACLAVFSCGIRLTPLEAVIDGCSYKEEGHWSETWQRCGRQQRGAAQPR